MATGTIRGELRGLVIRVHGRIVVVTVAAETGVGCIVVVTVMTCCAVIADHDMCPGQHVVVVMDREGGRHPVRRRSMAHRTVGRETQSLVVGIGAAIEISCMTSGTGVGGIVVIAVVASRTVAGDGYVGTVQYPEIVMIRELRRTPTGIRGMAGCTIHGEVQRSVIGVGSLVEVCGMTGITIGRRPDISG